MLKEIKGFEGLYSVDENGRVYSLRSAKRLKEIRMQSGYMYVHLCNGKNKTKLVRLHRIVAEAFLEPKEGMDQVNHINGNKADNRAENLEWCTQKQNTIHAIKTGLYATSGENNPSAKLTYEQVKSIRNEYIRNDKERGTKGLARKYGVTDVMIGKIVRNECWKDAEHSLHRRAGDI